MAGVLKQYGIRPTMFLTRSYVDSNPALFRTLRAADEAGIDSTQIPQRNLLRQRE